MHCDLVLSYHRCGTAKPKRFAFMRWWCMEALATKVEGACNWHVLQHCKAIRLAFGFVLHQALLFLQDGVMYLCCWLLTCRACVRPCASYRCTVMMLSCEWQMHVVPAWHTATGGSALSFLSAFACAGSSVCVVRVSQYRLEDAVATCIDTAKAGL
jgi:hypothetical protein